MNAKLEWLKRRQILGVGSSESPVLALGEVYGHTPVDLYIGKKKTLTEDDLLSSKTNPHLRRGHTYEPLAAAMFEAQTGIKVYAPVTDDERYNTFQVSDPNSPLFADFDGFCEDGWVLEIKSPMQRVADSFRSSGVRDSYLVQCQHHAHCANVCELPFLPDPKKWLGKVKGTRLVIYECENVALQIIELPIDEEMIEVIKHNATRFWKEAVEPGVPPATKTYKQPAKRPARAKYTQLEGEAWNDAVNTLKLAKEREVAAAKAMDAAKRRIAGVMEEAKLDAVQVGPHKFLYREVAGRKSFDKKALQADYPDLDLKKYDKQGEPRMQFNYYGPKDKKKADAGNENESQIITIQTELEDFAGRDHDIEVGMEEFDELRARADLYTAMLELELEDIHSAIENAAKAIVPKLD